MEVSQKFHSRTSPYIHATASLLPGSGRGDNLFVLQFTARLDRSRINAKMDEHEARSLRNALTEALDQL